MGFVGPPPAPKFRDDLIFLLAGSLGACPFPILDQAHFLRLFDRIFPSYYVEALKFRGGYEVFQSIALVGERLSTAVHNMQCESYISWAHGGTRARGSVLFSRQNAGAGAVTVKAGTIVKTEKNGRMYRTTVDTPFSAIDIGPLTAPVEALAAGWEYNQPGVRFTAAGETIPGPVTKIELMIQDPPFGDPTIQVSQSEDITGGHAAMLDQLGEDRGLLRRPGEDDEQYRIRIRQLPDTVSPDAMLRSVFYYLNRLGFTFDFIEPFDISYQTVWDGPTVKVGRYDPTTFTYDDPRPLVPFKNRWLSDDDAAGSFIVLVPNFKIMREHGYANDDPALTALQFKTKGNLSWSRAMNAPDLPQVLQPNTLPGANDGMDTLRQATLRGLYDLLQSIKLAGIDAGLEMEFT